MLLDNYVSGANTTELVIDSAPTTEGTGASCSDLLARGATGADMGLWNIH